MEKKEPSASVPDGGEPGTVLVCGDWFVDENWLFGVHRSASSSRTGRAHLRALNPPGGGAVQAFCGAGRTAAFLHQMCSRTFGHVVGLGFWHKDDTDALTSLFDPCAAAHIPYRLSLPALENPERISLVNMNDALHADWDKHHSSRKKRDEIEYTTRIIRTYREVSRGVVEYERLDWEPPRGDKRIYWSDDKKEHMAGLIADAVQQKPPIVAVVLKDLLKGVASPQFVEWLADKFSRSSHTTWYVSSKQWDPKWVKDLTKVNLRLFLVPQVAAQEAIRRKLLSCWITPNGRLTEEALSLAGGLVERSGAERVVVLPDSTSAVVYDPRAPAGSKDCVVQFERSPEEFPVPMGGASIFFPAMVTCMHTPDPPALEDAVNLSLRVARDWTRSEARRVLDPISWSPDPSTWSDAVTLKQLSSVLTEEMSLSALASSISQLGEVRTYRWATEQDDWTAALDFNRYGVIANAAEGKKQLQLWRSTVEVEGYVCCETDKRRKLRALTQGIRAFAESPRYHVSCMFLAPPGTGKTYLAQQLAAAAGLRFLPFNITQMRSKADLLECFETIVARQSKSPERLIVFIDEVNADLDGAPVYGAFLAPMEDGAYVRNGLSYRINPCAWVFAGTDDPRRTLRGSRGNQRTPPNAQERVEKGSDFAARLTLKVFDLRPADLDRDLTRMTLRVLEHVYIGALLLRAEFPDVRRVSQEVLWAFGSLPADTRVRDIKHFVRRFENIQYGEVRSNNVPRDDWPEDAGRNRYLNWKNKIATYAPEESEEGEEMYRETADIEIVDA